jgi:hypothetical protein
MLELDVIIANVAEAHDADRNGVLDETTVFRIFEFVNKLHEILPKPSPASILQEFVDESEQVTVHADDDYEY